MSIHDLRRKLLFVLQMHMLFEVFEEMLSPLFVLEEHYDEEEGM